MSASLVGSEMCIRDSSLPAARNPRKLLHAPSSRSECRRRPREVRRCLLYTSDAADTICSV
eukprot:9370194-Alexandrium_andersonii.AAC.1